MRLRRGTRVRLPLRGADLVLMAMHQRWKRAGVSRNALLIVECDGPLDPARVRRALGAFVEICPWAAARLARPRPWGKLGWVVAPGAPRSLPPVRERSADSGDDVHRIVEHELNADLDPRRGPPLRALVLEDRSGDAARGVLVLTWFHPFMDPRGAQALLARLDALDRDDGAWARRRSELTRAPDGRPLRERGQIARRSLAYMRCLAPVPPVSPGTGRAPTGSIRFRVATCAAQGGARDICGRLAVVGRAMADLWVRRRLPDVPFVVAVGVDLRPKGASGPIVGNCLAFHFARFRPSETADPERLTNALRQQMADAVRDGQIEANATAMDFLQYRPLAAIPGTLPWAAGGETFSFNCADVTDFPRGLADVFGRRVVNAYHVPAVLPRPGLGVFFNRCGPRDNIVVAWAEGAVSEAEAIGVLDDVRDGMGWRFADDAAAAPAEWALRR